MKPVNDFNSFFLFSSVSKQLFSALHAGKTFPMLRAFNPERRWIYYKSRTIQPACAQRSGFAMQNFGGGLNMDSHFISKLHQKQMNAQRNQASHGKKHPEKRLPNNRH
jgi:hypothetical protein